MAGARDEDLRKRSREIMEAIISGPLTFRRYDPISASERQTLVVLDEALEILAKPAGLLRGIQMLKAERNRIRAVHARYEAQVAAEDRVSQAKRRPAPGYPKFLAIAQVVREALADYASAASLVTLERSCRAGREVVQEMILGPLQIKTDKNCREIFGGGKFLLRIDDLRCNTHFKGASLGEARAGEVTAAKKASLARFAANEDKEPMDKKSINHSFATRAAAGDLNAVRKLFRRSRGVDVDGSEALLRVCEAPIDARHPDERCGPKDEIARLAMVKCLMLECGAVPMVQHIKFSPMHAAAKRGNLPLMALLLSAGSATIHVLTPRVFASPLELAVRHGRSAATRWLIDKAEALTFHTADVRNARMADLIVALDAARRLGEDSAACGTVYALVLAEIEEDFDFLGIDPGVSAGLQITAGMVRERGASFREIVAILEANGVRRGPPPLKGAL